MRSPRSMQLFHLHSICIFHRMSIYGGYSMKKYGLLFLVILEAGVSFVLQGAERERKISIKAGEEIIRLSEAQFEQLEKASEPIRNMLEAAREEDVRIPLPDVAPETVCLLLYILASPGKITRLEMDQLIPLIKLYHFLKLDHKDLVDKEASLTHLFEQIGTQYDLSRLPDDPRRLPDDLERLFLQFYLGHPIERTLRFDASVNSVALSRDGTIAMAGLYDGTAKIYEVITGRLHTLQFEDSVLSVALSADGKVAMAGSRDGTARIYEVATGRLHTLRFNGGVYSVALSADGTIAMAGSYGGTAKIYNVGTDREPHTLQFEDSVLSVALSADGKVAMAGSNDKTARIYDVRTGELLRTLRFDDLVRSVALSADGKAAMAGSNDKTARIYDVRTGELLRILQFDNLVPSVALSVSADGTIAMAGEGERPFDTTAQIYTAQIYDEAGKLHTLRFNDGVHSVALSADGTIAMAGSWDRTAQIYDVRTSGLLHTLRFSRPVFSVALSQDGKIAMAGSNDKTAKIIIAPDDLAILRDMYSRMIAARTMQAMSEQNDNFL